MGSRKLSFMRFTRFNQDNNWVTQKLLEWIHDLVQKYNLDGIRIDTIMEVPK